MKKDIKPCGYSIGVKANLNFTLFKLDDNFDEIPFTDINNDENELNEAINKAIHNDFSSNYDTDYYHQIIELNNGGLIGVRYSDCMDIGINFGDKYE